MLHAYRKVCCPGIPLTSPPKRIMVRLDSSKPIDASFRGGGIEPESRDERSIHCKGGTGRLVDGD